MLCYHLPSHSKYSSPTRNTGLPIRSTRFSTGSTRLFFRSTGLSNRSICLSTLSTHSTICRSFYN